MRVRVSEKECVCEREVQRGQEGRGRGSGCGVRRVQFKGVGGWGFARLEGDGFRKLSYAIPFQGMGDRGVMVSGSGASMISY